VLEGGGRTLTSGTVAFSVLTPAKGDREHDSVGRIHHLPWTNYDTNKYCGDTFDLVKRWPTSRLAKHCHYWNGRFLQNTKEYEAAIASYRLVIGKYPRFALTDDAAFGIVQCLAAQGKTDAARRQNASVLTKFRTQSAVGVLAKAMAVGSAGDSTEGAK
jgi:hypothetical protein